MVKKIYQKNIGLILIHFVFDSENLFYILVFMLLTIVFFLYQK